MIKMTWPVLLISIATLSCSNDDDGGGKVPEAEFKAKFNEKFISFNVLPKLLNILQVCIIICLSSN